MNPTLMHATQRKLFILILAAALLSGCSTLEQRFSGRVENASGEGWIEEGAWSTGFQSERIDNRDLFIGFLVDPEARLIARLNYRREGKYNVSSGTANPIAWLVNLSDESMNLYGTNPLSSQILSSNSIPLVGEMVVNWKSYEDFRLEMNLRSESEPPAIIQGAFESDRNFDFQLHLIPLMIAYDTGLYRPSSRPESTTAIAPLSTLPAHLRPLLKTRKFRSFHFRVQPPLRENTNPRYFTVINQPYRADRRGVQFTFPLHRDELDRFEQTRSSCRANGIRLLKMRMTDGQYLARADLYGDRRPDLRAPTDHPSASIWDKRWRFSRIHLDGLAIGVGDSSQGSSSIPPELP